MINKLERSVNTILSKFPVIKKIIKRVYQVVMYTLSSKIKSEGDIKKVTPHDDYEYFFGYYDKSPWDYLDRYMLCLRVKETYKSVAPKEEAEIILIDTHNNNTFKVIAETRAWNVQQGCMLQWLGPDYLEKIIYNDFRDGRYCSVILNIKTKEEVKIDMPVYSVSGNGKFALTLDFSRLHSLRKGYGYSNLPDNTRRMACPNQFCIWSIDLQSGKIQGLLKYTNLKQFENKKNMENAIHKVNHLMISPNGRRFMFLHRWFQGNQKLTRLLTADIDGKNLYNLSDDDMVSHCCWKNHEEIFAFERKKKEGNGYYLMKDRSKKYKRFWPAIDNDGHPSFSPDSKKIVFDTYPDKRRIAKVKITSANDIEGMEIRVIAKVFTPFKYDNDTRCDLHPRWNRAGDKICIDSVFEGRRGLYICNIKGKRKII